MHRRRLLVSLWLLIVCAAGHAWAGGPKLVTLVQDGTVAGSTVLSPGAHGQVSVHHGARQSRSGSSGLVSYHCEFTLEEASALGMVPATAGFRGRAGGLTMGVDDRDSFPAPVLGPFMLCSVECIPGTPPAPPCMGTVTLKALLSK
jgi:hypothetical protein